MEDNIKNEWACSGFFNKEMLIANEGSIIEIGKKIVEKISYQASRLFSSKKNMIFEDFMKSKGDIKKTKPYKDTIFSLECMENLSAQGGGNIDFIKNLRIIHDFLIKQKDIFGKGFEEKNEIVISFYCSASMIWTYGVSRAILTGVSFDKGIISWKKNIQTNSKKNASPEKIAAEMAKDIISGKLKDSVKRSLEYSLVGSEAPAILFFGVTGVVLVSIYFVRSIVFWILATRVKLSEWLDSQAYFARVIALNNPKISVAQRKEQEGYAKKLEDLSKKINANLDDEDEALQKAIDEDQNEVRMEIKNSEEKTEERISPAIMPTPESSKDSRIGLLNF
jgi:hypothetical protein